MAPPFEFHATILHFVPNFVPISVPISVPHVGALGECFEHTVQEPACSTACYALAMASLPGTGLLSNRRLPKQTVARDRVATEHRSALELHQGEATMRRSMPRFVGLAALVMFAVSSSACVRVLQDEVGVKRRYGALSDKTLEPGLRAYNPFSEKVFRLKTRTVSVRIEPDLPSREGLTVRSEMSILYRIDPNRAPDIIRRIGVDYEEDLILPVFRSASADVCARFFAKDMHSASRRAIEVAIQARMMEVLEDRGFVIEAVLLKSVTLPNGLSNAIEDKLEAEQVAQRMEFEIQRENAEAQRTKIAAEAKRTNEIIAAEADRDSRIIEAEGIRQATVIRAKGVAEANEAINRSLTPNVLKHRQIEAFRDVAQSNNAKLIITDGKTPVINPQP